MGASYRRLKARLEAAEHALEIARPRLIRLAVRHRDGCVDDCDYDVHTCGCQVCTDARAVLGIRRVRTRGPLVRVS